MVEINNQRKAFLDMLAWSEGTDNGRQTEIMIADVDLAAESYLPDYSEVCPRKLVAKPKTQINRRRTLPASPLVGCLRKQLGLKDFSKVRDAVALQQIKAYALPMIDRGDINEAIPTVAAISGLHCRALVVVSFKRIRLTAWLQNSKKRAERSERLIWAVTAIISALVICIIIRIMKL